MKYSELNNEDKPLARFDKWGAEYLSIADLIQIASGCNSVEAVQGVAEEPLQYIQDMSEYAYINKGMTKKQRAAIMAGIEIGRRMAQNKYSVNIVNGPDDVGNYLLPRYQYKNREHFGIICLNAKNHIIYTDTISIGHLTGTVVHPREVFKSAITHNAASIILYHNHPSGDPDPSREDISTTERMVKAGKLLDIPVLDHIILGFNRYSSLKEKGLI